MSANEEIASPDNPAEEAGNTEFDQAWNDVEEVPSGSTGGDDSEEKNKPAESGKTDQDDSIKPDDAEKSPGKNDPADSSTKESEDSEKPDYSFLDRIDQENGAPAAPAASRLSNWPVQIKLAAVNAPYFSGADLLIAADCTAYAYGNFHQRFISGRIALIGCPKLDAVDYTEKLAAIISANDIRSITVTRMEVPCCGGLQRAVEEALRRSGKQLPLDVVTISIRGEIK